MSQVKPTEGYSFVTYHDLNVLSEVNLLKWNLAMVFNMKRGFSYEST